MKLPEEQMLKMSALFTSYRTNEANELLEGSVFEDVEEEEEDDDKAGVISWTGTD